MKNIGTDLLYDAAKVYQDMQDFSLTLLIGRRGQSEKIEIIFDDSDFHHLAGLHKLKDINQVYKENAKIVFRKILNGEIKYSDIEKSNFINQVDERLTIVKSFRTIFSNPSTVFKFRKVVIQHSQIRWKYLLEFIHEDGALGYLFLDEYRLKPGNHVCVSNFYKKIDYGFQQIKYTLLKIDATHLSSGSSEIWYQNSVYKL